MNRRFNPEYADGRDLLRARVRALLLGKGNPATTIAIQEEMGIADAIRTKADVSAVDFDHSAWHGAARAFMELVEAESLLATLPTTPLPFSTRELALTIGVSAGFRAEGLAAPLRKPTFVPAALLPKTVTGITAVDGDVIDLVRNAEDFVLRELARAVRVARDTTFMGSSASSAAAPAGVRYVASTVATTGATAAAITTDVSGMIAIPAAAHLLGPSSVFVVTPKGRAALGMLKLLDADGTLAGFRVIAHPAAPGLTLICCDRVGVATSSDDVMIATSTNATLEMATDGTGDTLTPAAMTKKPVSLFQADAIGLRATIYTNWSVVSPVDGSSKNKAVVDLTSATWV